MRGHEKEENVLVLHLHGERAQHLGQIGAIGKRKLGECRAIIDESHHARFGAKTGTENTTDLQRFAFENILLAKPGKSHYEKLAATRSARHHLCQLTAQQTCLTIIGILDIEGCHFRRQIRFEQWIIRQQMEVGVKTHHVEPGITKAGQTQ